MTSNPYDPQAHITPPGGEAPRADHAHRRKYDNGLVPAPTGARWSGKIVLAIVLTAAVSFFGAFYTIGHATQDACEQRQELASTLVDIIKRGEPRLREFYKSGVIDKTQYVNAINDNRKAIADLQFPSC